VAVGSVIISGGGISGDGVRDITVAVVVVAGGGDAVTGSGGVRASDATTGLGALVSAI
jgi:hypothetical protein